MAEEKEGKDGEGAMVLISGGNTDCSCCSCCRDIHATERGGGIGGESEGGLGFPPGVEEEGQETKPWNNSQAAAVGG